MRVLLAQNLFFHRTHGGAGKANRILLAELAARGHECRVVAPVTGEVGRTSPDELLAGLAARGVRPEGVADGLVTARLDGVLAHLVLDPSGLAGRARRAARDFAPDWILVPSDDPGMMMLGVAQNAAPGRVVYLAHTLQQLPFGPRAFYPSAAGTRLVRGAAGVVTVSRAAQDYLDRWGGIAATLIRPHVYGQEPAATPPGDAVTMVNPCGYKGLALFLALADALPAVRFLAVRSWGTTSGDLAELARRPNIETLAPSDDLGPVWARSKAVLMPSLWDETFGFTAVEAMLRGIPVLASAVGGLVEAKLGVPYSLPVRPIERYAGTGGRPEPQVPAQDVRPWLAALRRVLDEPGHHAELARSSRTAALAFVRSLDPGALESYLAGLRSIAPAPPPADDHRRAALARLLTRDPLT